ncbi:hypothetical protein BDV93DRAFT_547115 [Ceratobasidium sp. AG-I]|nr:hypothetical protein BDV93DRAFT_547115 [Ceratobasidium sp. AG-I]
MIFWSYLLFIAAVHATHMPALRNTLGRPRRAEHAGVAHDRRPTPRETVGDLNIFPPQRSAQVKEPLPFFELAYGQAAEYNLGRALEASVQIRGGSLKEWPYEVRPDLSGFSWMNYERARRVIGGTPPAAQPLPVISEAISYIEIYVFIGADKTYTLRTTLGVSIRATNVSIAPSILSTPTSAPPIATLNSPKTAVPRPHGTILALLIAACVLISLLILGSFAWFIAIRRHLNHQRPIAQSHTSAEEFTNGGLVSARWHRTSAHSLSLAPNHEVPVLEGSARRRVRTTDLESPVASAMNVSSPDRGSLSLEQPTSSRKRAATLLQAIHTRAIRGSPKIGPSKSVAAESSGFPTRKAFSPRMGFGQSSPRIGIRIKKDEETPIVEQTPTRAGFTNSWCSVLQADPFQSPGASLDMSHPLGSPAAESAPVMETPKAEMERPKSPTPKKSAWRGGDRTMSTSELRDSLTTVGRTIWKAEQPEDKDRDGNLTKLSPAPARSCADAASTPRLVHAEALPTGLKNTSEYFADRKESYMDQKNQLGMALLTPLPDDAHLGKVVGGSLGLSFDSFFSPTSPDDNTIAIQDLLEPRYVNVSSERLVQIARSQETLATTYVTAQESGTSPKMFGDDNGSARHAALENMGVIGSPSTLHSEMAELDDISSPLLTVPGTHEDEDKTQIAEISNQSLSVEYGRGEQSLRVLDSFPGMLHGSLSYFPEDVELRMPVLRSNYRSEQSYQEPSDILILPEEDIDEGRIRLARVDTVPRTGGRIQHESVAQAESSQVIIVKSSGDVTSGSDEVEDSIVSPDVSEKYPRDAKNNRPN